MNINAKQTVQNHHPLPNDEYYNLVRVNNEGLNTLSLLVNGVHCAMCIQKIESSLVQEQDVQQARLNFSTGRLNIIWSGSSSRADDFVRKVKSLGYSVFPFHADIEKSTAENEDKFLLKCLGVSGFATGNIMLIAVALWTTSTETMGLATRELLHAICGLIAIPAVVYAGRPFFSSAFSVLKKGQTNMDVPISLGLVLACGMSVFEMLRGAEHVYFDAAVMLMFFLLIGRYLDFRARRSARSAASDLLKSFSGFATILENGETKRVLIRDLREGMRVLVSTGESFPADGQVESGESSVDTSLITGETTPRDVRSGDHVYAGTMNQAAPLTVIVSKAAEDSLLSDVVRLMEKAEQGQAAYVRLADRVSRLYTPVVHILALSAFILWWGFLGASWQDSLMIAVTVLIVTCPCALGLAVPVVQVLASGVLMKNGILVKSGDALERLAVIDTIFFDKTGTLTLGKPQLIGTYDAEKLQIAVSLATHSRHPLSQALAASFEGQLLPVSDIREVPGKGMEGRYGGNIIQLGSRPWCGDMTAPPSDFPEIWLRTGDSQPTVFRFKDQLKEDAASTIRELETKGLAIHLLSGDRQDVVSAIANEISIQNISAELTPIGKYEQLEALKASGHKIMMVGDGLNDAPVLAGADVSMAPGTAIDMAQNAADIVFMGNKLAPVALAYRISRFTQTLVKENFVISIVYNFIAVPAAFCGLITPMWAALAMSGSSLVVIGNSFRLKHMKERK